MQTDIPQPSIATLQQEWESALAQASLHLSDEDVTSAFAVLGPRLSSLWTSAPDGCARQRLKDYARGHGIFSMVLEDPYSRRAFHKPRGYAGDAVMLDYVYSGRAPEGTSQIGVTVFHGTTRGPMGLSVLFRRELLRSYINHLAGSKEKYRILSVASGHCRELEGSLFQNQRKDGKGQFVAIDQDPLSCEEVLRQNGGLPVEVRVTSVKTLVAQDINLGEFDLIYSAGLLDYLPDDIAKKLIGSLISRLTPEGRLLVGNFMPTCYGRGYMESLLEWNLIYRTQDELGALGTLLGAVELNRFIDPHRNVCYCEWGSAVAAA